MKFLESFSITIASLTLMSSSMNSGVHAAGSVYLDECMEKAAQATTKKDCFDIDYEVRFNKNGKNKCKCKNPKVLVAVINSFGDDSSTYGTAQVSVNQDDSFVVSLSLNFLSGSDNGSVLIVDYDQCDGATPEVQALGEQYNKDNDYHALGDFTASKAVSKSAYRYVGTDISSHDMVGKAVIIVNTELGTIGCGILEVKTRKKLTLVADMEGYPGYMGALTPAGKVFVEFGHGEIFKFKYDLSGLGAGCSKCGIHIHAGVSCDSPEVVLGHGYNNNLVEDLWTLSGGSTYTTDSDGTGKGYFYLINGFGYYENTNHAVVIHAQNGSRVGCGQLK